MDSAEKPAVAADSATNTRTEFDFQKLITSIQRRARRKLLLRKRKREAARRRAKRKRRKVRKHQRRVLQEESTVAQKILVFLGIREPQKERKIRKRHVRRRRQKRKMKHARRRHIRRIIHHRHRRKHIRRQRHPKKRRIISRKEKKVAPKRPFNLLKRLRKFWKKHFTRKKLVTATSVVTPAQEVLTTKGTPVTAKSAVPVSTTKAPPPATTKSSKPPIKIIKYQSPITYQTEIDTLYQMVLQRGKITLEEVMKTFTIKKELAEEWAKILESHQLISVEYPPFSSPVLMLPKPITPEENPHG